MTSTNTYTQALHALVPVARSLNIEVIDWNPQQVHLCLDYTAERCTAGGVLHGGVIMTLADTAGAVSAYTSLPEGNSTTTIESKTNFFRGVSQGHIEACSFILHQGQSIIVVSTDVTDADGRPVAHIVQSQSVITTN